MSSYFQVVRVLKKATHFLTFTHRVQVPNNPLALTIGSPAKNVLDKAPAVLRALEFTLPYGSKDPKNRVLGRKYYNIYGVWVLGPLGLRGMVWILLGAPKTH